MASTLYGEPRATMDVDFAVQLARQKAGPLARALDRGFFVDHQSVVEAATPCRHFNVIHKRSMVKVDLYARPAEGIFAEEIRRARRVRLRAGPEGYASVATPEDTLLQKLRRYHMGGEVSDRQWRDCLGVLKAMGDDLDHAYLEHWAAELSLGALLDRAIKESGETESWRS